MHSWLFFNGEDKRNESHLGEGGGVRLLISSVFGLNRFILYVFMLKICMKKIWIFQINCVGEQNSKRSNFQWFFSCVLHNFFEFWHVHNMFLFDLFEKWNSFMPRIHRIHQYFVFIRFSFDQQFEETFVKSCSNWVELFVLSFQFLSITISLKHWNTQAIFCINQPSQPNDKNDKNNRMANGKRRYVHSGSGLKRPSKKLLWDFGFWWETFAYSSLDWTWFSELKIRNWNAFSPITISPEFILPHTF